LQKDPNKRMKINEALDDLWFKKMKEKKETNLF
jgi:hypothetical protein